MKSTHSKVDALDNELFASYEASLIRGPRQVRYFYFHLFISLF